jgi:hypothetical protein
MPNYLILIWDSFPDRDKDLSALTYSGANIGIAVGWNTNLTFFASMSGLMIEVDGLRGSNLYFLHDSSNHQIIYFIRRSEIVKF